MNFSISTVKELRSKQYLDSIFKVFPNNAYINKFLPNTGATTLEIKAHRHSIIIEPNVPVIEGKEAKYNKDVLIVRGVYEDIKMQHILDYLNSDCNYKKIITTPESYPKVRSAINRSKFSLYKDFFILLDESDRVIQDCIYRPKIILPFEDFFKYKQKAMISATPLFPSDPRFKRFTHIRVVAKFRYKKPLSLITTNSIKLSLTKYLENHPDDHYCIFLNSTDVISSIIDALGIREETNIYCSKESVYTLKINGFPNSYEKLSAFKKYNFFTSRFFSAVDIDLPYKPTVIMLTDTTHAFHSIIDPHTEAVQILGRFRNGIKQAVHITTIDKLHTPKTVCEARSYLEGCEQGYLEMQRFFKAATNPGFKASFKEALERVEYAQFLNEDGSKNYFMWDNYINEERVKAYYTSRPRLINAYKECKQFKMSFSEPDNFPDIEVVLNRLTKIVSRNLVCRTVCDILENLYLNSEKYSVEDIQFVYKQIERTYPETLEAYQNLGFSKMNELEFNIFKVRKATYSKKSAEEKGGFELLNYLKLEFEVGSSYPSQIIVRVLRSIITELNLTLKPEIKLLKEYFDLGPRTTVARDSSKKDIKGYTILKRNFN